MAVVVVITTTSFTVDMHYCGSSLVDFSFFDSADGCGMEKIETPSSCEDATITQTSCCTDKQIAVEGQDDMKQDAVKLSKNQQLFVAAFTYSYLNIFNDLRNKDNLVTDYPPPLPKNNVYILYQTFLI